MEERDWDRSQSKFFLMAILSHGYQKVPADLLIEDLWPESPLASGEKNLKITLHRLRKSLEPDLEKGFGSSYIHLQDHLIFLDQAFCHVDFERFLSLIQKGEEAEESGTLKKAVSLYTEAEELYRGDFLPEVASAPWADRKREELRDKFIDLLQRLANLYEKQGAVMKAIACCQKGIKDDPLLEESYQKLMTLCMNKGIRNEALKAYEACKKALKVGLNTKPDPTTTALYRKILEETSTG
jgi:LuxR family transcriptional regulator, maltose regulon positive regulatory protein